MTGKKLHDSHRETERERERDWFPCRNCKTLTRQFEIPIVYDAPMA